mgnify:CR=1 FL=1
MKISYNPKRNIAYIQLQKRETTVKSHQLSDDVVIDISADGKIFGIELLNANEQLRLDAGKLLVENELTGECHKINF